MIPAHRPLPRGPDMTDNDSSQSRHHKVTSGTIHCWVVISLQIAWPSWAANAKFAMPAAHANASAGLRSYASGTAGQHERRQDSWVS